MHCLCSDQKSMAFESEVETQNRQPEIDNPRHQHVKLLSEFEVLRVRRATACPRTRSGP